MLTKRYLKVRTGDLHFESRNFRTSLTADTVEILTPNAGREIEKVIELNFETFQRLPFREQFAHVSYVVGNLLTNINIYRL